MMFLFNYVIFQFQPLIFRGVEEKKERLPSQRVQKWIKTQRLGMETPSRSNILRLNTQKRGWKMKPRP